MTAGNVQVAMPPGGPTTPPPTKITMDQGILLTATCCMIRCILLWLFLAAPRLEAKHLQASLLFFLLLVLVWSFYVKTVVCIESNFLFQVACGCL